MSDPMNDEPAPDTVFNGGTTSATDDSSVGFGSRPHEYEHDLGMDEDSADRRNEEFDLDAEAGTAIDVDREATGITGAPGTAATPEEEMPD